MYKKSCALGLATLGILTCLGGVVGIEASKITASGEFSIKYGPIAEVYLGQQSQTKVVVCSLGLTSLDRDLAFVANCMAMNKDPENMDPETIFDFGKEFRP